MKDEKKKCPEKEEYVHLYRHSCVLARFIMYRSRPGLRAQCWQQQHELGAGAALSPKNCLFGIVVPKGCPRYLRYMNDYVK